MEKVIDAKIPIKMWAKEIEDSAMEQIMNLSELPFAFHHIAIMPDCHSGFGMPIGGVLATKSVVIPNAVGVDISCGMCAIKTSMSADDLSKEDIKKFFGGCKEYHGGIRELIPVGFNHHDKAQDESLMPDLPMGKIVTREYPKALKQLGSLGGGNHFFEIQRNDEGLVCFMIHSGSRNLGKQVADYYNNIAKDLNAKYFSQVSKKADLAFLPIDSQEGQDYLTEMNYCIGFAKASRTLMMQRAMDYFLQMFPVQFGDVIDITHNYASTEHHFGENVMVHRKGATLARKEIIGIIPGSQGTCSYIVEGLGNPDSFMSCSHGAGRLMSRTKAIGTLDLEKEKKIMDDKGIVHGIRNQKDLDESSSAYKNIDEVMENQKDLVKIISKLEPMGVIKG